MSDICRIYVQGHMSDMYVQHISFLGFQLKSSSETLDVGLTEEGCCLYIVVGLTEGGV